MKQKIKVKIERQGSPLVNADNAIIEASGKDIVAICVDIRSKYCEVDAIVTAPSGYYQSIWIGATRDSVNLHKKKRKDENTNIHFPEYYGYTIFNHRLSGHTLRVCLIKKQQP